MCSNYFCPNFYFYSFFSFEEFMVAISVISHGKLLLMFYLSSVMTLIYIKGDIRKKLEITFDIYDINKNGKIDKKEITKLIEEIYDLTGETKRDGDNAPAEKMKTIMAQLGKEVLITTWLLLGND